MSIFKKITAMIVSAAIICTGTNAVYAENQTGGDVVNINIDGSKANVMKIFFIADRV